jgi:hypothetical protein
LFHFNGYTEIDRRTIGATIAIVGHETVIDQQAFPVIFLEKEDIHKKHAALGCSEK